VDDPVAFTRVAVADPATFCACQGKTRHEAKQQGAGDLGAARLAAINCQP
jgi:hypothetical protein